MCKMRASDPDMLVEVHCSQSASSSIRHHPSSHCLKFSRFMATATTSSSPPTPAAAATKKGWLNSVSSIASRVFFFLIILQIPLFRVSCRSGMCMTPIHVTSSQLIASEVFPVGVVKAILYPGAVINGLVTNMSVPSWNDLLDIYNLTTTKDASPVTDLQRLEILAGSYFAVAGSLVGLLKPGRMSMFGTLLILWGLVKEGLLGKPANTDPSKAIYVYPTMMLAMIFAFLSVKYDLKKVARSVQHRPVAKPLQSSRKNKLK